MECTYSARMTIKATRYPITLVFEQKMLTGDLIHFELLIVVKRGGGLQHKYNFLAHGDDVVVSLCNIESF